MTPQEIDRRGDIRRGGKTLVDEMISRNAAIDLFPNDALEWDTKGGYIAPHLARQMIEELPFAQPEITDEQAIEHLQSTGWMQNHDREMYESGLREQLADDSGSYDSLIPCEDTISRQAAIDAVIKRDANCGIDSAEVLKALPSAQPEYEPVSAEDFAKMMSEVSLYNFVTWHQEALTLMKKQGFVICKKT